MDFKIYSPEYIVIIEPTSMKKLVWDEDTGDFLESSRTVYKGTAKLYKNLIVFDQIWIDESSNTVAHTVPVMIRGNK